MLSPHDVLREQITAAFDCQPVSKRSDYLGELPANAIVVETFVETCGILGVLVDFGTDNALVGALMVEFFDQPNDPDLREGVEGIFYFLRSHPPFLRPTVPYTTAQIEAVQAWLQHIGGRDDLQLFHDEAEEISALWQAAEASHSSKPSKKPKKKRPRH